MGRVLRAAVFAGLAIAIWTIALPAYASPAPLCDDRGATALAGPPVGEPADIAIERARLSLPCEGDAPIGVAVSPGQRSHVPQAPSAEPAVPSVAPSVIAPPAEPMLDTARVFHAPEGVRSRVERPPRG